MFLQVLGDRIKNRPGCRSERCRVNVEAHTSQNHRLCARTTNLVDSYTARCARTLIAIVRNAVAIRIDRSNLARWRRGWWRGGGRRWWRRRDVRRAEIESEPQRK